MSATNASAYDYQALKDDFYYIAYQSRGHELPLHREQLAKMPGKQQSKRVGNPIEAIAKTAPTGKEWIIKRRGKSQFAFRLVEINRIVPNPQLAPIEIPDATPEIISAYALSDEQALLAKVRYNRLLDIFLGVATYSLQNHLRTSVANIGQVEIDEMYVAIDKRGRHYILPVQAKGGSDQLSTVQAKQDIACCAEKFPGLICRAISAQFIEDDLIALFELAPVGDEIKIVEERHYKLVPSDQISSDDLKIYDA